MLFSNEQSLLILCRLYIVCGETARCGRLSQRQLNWLLVPFQLNRYAFLIMLTAPELTQYREKIPVTYQLLKLNFLTSSLNIFLNCLLSYPLNPMIPSFQSIWERRRPGERVYDKLTRRNLMESTR